MNEYLEQLSIVEDKLDRFITSSNLSFDSQLHSEISKEINYLENKIKYDLSLDRGEKETLQQLIISLLEYSSDEIIK